VGGRKGIKLGRKLILAGPAQEFGSLTEEHMGVSESFTFDIVVVAVAVVVVVLLLLLVAVVAHSSVARRNEDIVLPTISWAKKEGVTTSTHKTVTSHHGYSPDAAVALHSI